MPTGDDFCYSLWRDGEDICFSFCHLFLRTVEMMDNGRYRIVSPNNKNVNEEYTRGGCYKLKS